MNQQDFMNRLKGLRFIDRARLPELATDDWQNFCRDPWLFLISASDKEAAAIWREVEEDQKPKRPLDAAEKAAIEAAEQFLHEADFNLTCWDAQGEGPTPAGATELYERAKAVVAMLKREPRTTETALPRAPMTDDYLARMRIYADDIGRLSHENGLDLLAEVERLRVAAVPRGALVMALVNLTAAASIHQMFCKDHDEGLTRHHEAAERIISALNKDFSEPVGIEMLEPILNTVRGALDNLRTNQRQLDADGTYVGVSRQALDEVLAAMVIQANERKETSHDR